MSKYIFHKGYFKKTLLVGFFLLCTYKREKKLFQGPFIIYVNMFLPIFDENACIGLKTVSMREDLGENRFAI